jgi:hypothetical protein
VHSATAAPTTRPAPSSNPPLPLQATSRSSTTPSSSASTPSARRTARRLSLRSAPTSRPPGPDSRGPVFASGSRSSPRHLSPRPSPAPANAPPLQPRNRTFRPRGRSGGLESARTEC